MMNMFDQGSGPPLLVIPGIQGRWEWMQPALRALAARCRAISYSLGPPSGTSADAAFAGFIAQADAVLDARGIGAAAICGVSFGGLIALKYAAVRPERTRALILVSTPSPSWTPSSAQARYLARPWLSAPAFVAGSPFRLWPEIGAAIPQWPSRLRFCAEHAARIATSPASPSQMAARIKLKADTDLCADCARVRAPTLVVTGDGRLDAVVPVDATREYTRLIAGAQYEMMSRTGHIGLVTQPDRFARLVGDFVNAHR
jgi:pimeloyl-ACP methyl ester carboxylesterase